MPNLYYLTTKFGPMNDIDANIKLGSIHSYNNKSSRIFFRKKNIAYSHDVKNWIEANDLRNFTIHLISYRLFVFESFLEAA